MKKKKSIESFFHKKKRRHSSHAQKQRHAAFFTVNRDSHPPTLLYNLQNYVIMGIKSFMKHIGNEGEWGIPNAHLFSFLFRNFYQKNISREKK